MRLSRVVEEKYALVTEARSDDRNTFIDFGGSQVSGLCVLCALRQKRELTGQRKCDRPEKYAHGYGHEIDNQI